MAREIERKFLLKNDLWRQQVSKKTLFIQGYLNQIEENSSKSSVRIRIEGEQANINIKSLEIGLSRDEYEYPIPVDEAQNMLKKLAVGPIIEKVRYLVELEDVTWEIDEFFGDNEGLVIAEVELETEDQTLTLEDWVGREVTDDVKYYNISLSKYPFKDWSDDEKN
ncbi:CYTH domain-containing protein [Thiomicrospira microaerophila]|uniref:CYTH domain-containing protein n=1 Tax=Thiomicrospira microaerophila TaxID=406020 RepID=UPI00200F7B70|nr:CYTH domain-containing protein [Thiomicrospira microaerophila]UQB43336.1 CYTH domain-containing protein [Thiomicrospira microaerophila]